MSSTALYINEINLSLVDPDQILLQFKQNFKKQAINNIVILFVVIPLAFSITHFLYT
ncbi:MAG: hypothetical protein KAH20_14265 [Methylococcales bacterium]|nr:hypothetical protein [Methylococcales bacterium]